MLTFGNLDVFLELDQVEIEKPTDSNQNYQLKITFQQKTFGAEVFTEYLIAYYNVFIMFYLNRLKQKGGPEEKKNWKYIIKNNKFIYRKPYIYQELTSELLRIGRDTLEELNLNKIKINQHLLLNIMITVKEKVVYRSEFQNIKCEIIGNHLQGQTIKIIEPAKQ